jgi:hypothetical protein
MAQFIQYAGFIPYNQSQTCILLSWIIGGFFVQFYLRNYHPRIFKDYSYLFTGAFDGASQTVLSSCPLLCLGRVFRPILSLPGGETTAMGTTTGARCLRGDGEELAKMPSNDRRESRASREQWKIQMVLNIYFV